MNDTAQHPELRTKICSYFKQGCCRAGDNCRFAHDDVSRVQACQYWISGELCPHADYCTFTHPIRIGERYHSSAYPSKLPFQQPTCIIKERMESLKWYWKFLHQDPKPDMLPRTNFRQEDYEHLRKTPNEYRAESKKAKEKARNAENEEDYAYWKDESYRLELSARWGHAHASSTIFKDCNPDYPSAPWIDLHGQHVHEALQYIHHWLMNYNGQTTRVSVVTGAGRHSLTAPKLRPKVKEYLEKYFSVREFNFVEDSSASGGVYLVILCKHAFWKMQTGRLQCKHCYWTEPATN